MAKRFTDTELWDKEWFMSLSCKHKCLVKMVRDKCDISGVWSPNWILASGYIGEPISEKDLIGIDQGKQFKKIPGGKILCIGFVEFQYGNLSEKSPVHRKIMNLLSTHQIPYQYPINSLKDIEEEKEEEEEEVKEEEKEKGKRSKKIKKHPEDEIEIFFPFNSENFRSAWDLWKKYKEKEFGFKYKSKISEQAGLKELGELADSEDRAIKIIHQSMAKRWQGLFELKENGTKQQTRASEQAEFGINLDNIIAAKFSS